MFRGFSWMWIDNLVRFIHFTLQGLVGKMAGDIGHDTADRRRNAIFLLEADFHGLLERKGVTEELQARLSVAGVRSISRFNAISDTTAELRQFCTRALDRDAARHAVEIAAILDAWEAAHTRMQVRHKAEAEAANANLPIAVNKVEIHDLRRKFEALHYKLEEKTMPASGTLEQLFDQIENGEMKVMHLAQFLSREDAEVDPLGATIDKAGNIKVRKGYGETTEVTRGISSTNEGGDALIPVGEVEVSAQAGFARCRAAPLPEVSGLHPGRSSIWTESKG